MAAHNYTATNSVWGFPFLHILSNTCCILMGMKWYLFVVLSCTFLTSDVENLLMCLLAIYIPALEECLFRTSAHFLIKKKLLLFFINFEYQPLIDTWCASIFCHLVACIFILLMASFAVQSFLVWRSHVVTFNFASFAWEYISRKILLKLMSKAYCPWFFSGVLWFQVLHSSL